MHAKALVFLQGFPMLQETLVFPNPFRPMTKPLRPRQRGTGPCYAGSINPWSHEHPRMKLCSGMLNSILIHLNSWFFSKLDFETFWVYNSTTFVALVTGVCKLASWSWAGQSQPTDVCGSWHCNGRFQAQLTTNAIPTSTSLALVHWYLALLFPQKMRCFSVWVCSLT